MSQQNLLLRADQINAMTAEHKIHFLNPLADRLSKSLGDATGLKNIGVHLVTVEPGKESTEYHIHYYEEECIYILSGRGLLILNEEQYEVGPNDFIGLPVNTAAHNLINHSEENLVFLVMGQRLTQDVGDYPKQGKRLYRNSGHWDLVNIADISDPKKK